MPVQADRLQGQYRESDGIRWYCWSRGSGPRIVLIPSGEGDCESFAEVALQLSARFNVLTFDMPGFSRSSDPPDFANYSWDRAASEIAGLVQSLGSQPATFYGCSSGGSFALRIAADYPEIVRNVVVHEVAAIQVTGMTGDFIAGTSATVPDPINDLAGLSDDQIVDQCRTLFRDVLNLSPEAWDAVGPSFHQRLTRNYVTWVRRYVEGTGSRRIFAIEELQRRPVSWTVGAFSPTIASMPNLQAAKAAGIPAKLLLSRHFPQVSVPQQLAAHIAAVAAGA